MNTFLKRVGISFPIIQAPMAAISPPEMAAAVANAGGLGSIGVGNVDAPTAKKMVASIRELTERPFNVNVFCHPPAIADPDKEAAWLKLLTPLFSQFNASPPKELREIYQSFLQDDAMLEMLIEERPPVVSFHFGLPSLANIRRLKDAGIILLATATNLSEAQMIYEAGIDAIVAQGYEAGGHRGAFDLAALDDRLSVAALTRLLVAKIPLPIIAAGGIMDGAGIAASLVLGASAVQLGTAFVLCPESTADAGYRKALQSDAANHTTMTAAISGRLARSLSNKFTELGATVDDVQIPAYPIAYDAGKSLHAAGKSAGEFGYGAQWAGQGAPLSRALPAGELVRVLWQETQEALVKSSTFQS